jgi:hypothetical protein
MEFQNKYQKLIGIGIWLVVIGRIDICYAIATLSRYSAAPTEQHLANLKRVFAYVNKYRNRGINIKPEDLQFDNLPKTELFKSEEMKAYYPDVEDIWDPKWPEPRGDPVNITIFVDSDHAKDSTDRRSITGFIIFLGKTPIKWSCKRQSSIETSTYGAELAALKTATEEAIAMVHTLRSIGVRVSTPVKIFCDNKSVVDCSTIPANVLQKRHSSIAYHKVRETVAVGLIQVFHIKSENNVADVLTKPLTSIEMSSHFKHFMSGFKSDESSPENPLHHENQEE